MSNPIARVWVQALPIGPMFAIDVGEDPVYIGSSRRAHVRVNHSSVASKHASLRLDLAGCVAVHDHTAGDTLLDGAAFDEVATLAMGSVLSFAGGLRLRIEAVDIPDELRRRTVVAAAAA